MRFLSIIALLSCSLALYMGFYVFLQDRRSRTSVLFLLLCASIGFWNFCYSFVYSATGTTEAVFWVRLASIGWIPFPLILFYFFLALTANYKAFKNILVLFLLVVPLTLFSYQYFCNYPKASAFMLTRYGYAELISYSDWWRICFYSYAFLIGAGCVIMGYSRAVMVRDRLQKKQLLIISTGALLSLLLFVTVVAGLPHFGIEVFPDVIPLCLVFALLALWYVVVRYRFFVLTPESIANEILGVMSEALLFVDTNWNISIANKAAEKMLKYSVQELTGMDFNSLCSGKGIFNKAFIESLLSRKQDMKDERAVLRDKTGLNVHVEFSLSVLSDSRGNGIGIVILLKDVRQRLELESKEAKKAGELEKAYADLERTQLASLNVTDDLERKSAELTEALEELRNAQAQLLQTEKMAAVGKLAGGIAHEINNPMTVILGYSQSLAGKIKPENELFAPVKAIETEALRVKRLVHDLLTFSRSAKTHFESVDFRKMLEGAMSLIRVQGKIKEIKMKTNIAAGVGSLEANSNQLEQVLINLCNNGIDAMGSGGTLSISARNEKGYLLVAVSDTGSGIAKSELGRIFEPFFTTKEIGKGTGLGLSLCYEIVKRHNGKIYVESEVGKGTTFTVTLPLKQPGAGNPNNL